MRILHISAEESNLLEERFGDCKQDICIDEAHTVSQAIEAAARSHYDCIFLDSDAGDINGLALLQSLRNRNIETPIVYSAGSNLDSKVRIAYQQDSGAFLQHEELPEGASLSALLREVSESGRKDRRMMGSVRSESSMPERLFRSLADTVPQGMLVLDPQGSILYANKSAAHLLRYESPNKLTSTTILKLFPLAFDNAGSADIRNFLKHEGSTRQNFRWKMVDRFGEHLHVRATGLPLTVEKKSYRALVFEKIDLAAEIEKLGQRQQEVDNEPLSTVVLCEGMMMRSGLQLLLSEQKDQYLFTTNMQVADDELLSEADMVLYACSSFDAEARKRVQQLLETDHPILVVALTGEAASLAGTVEDGVRGMVVGEKDFEKIPGIIRHICNGAMWYSEDVFNKIIGHNKPETKKPPGRLKDSPLTRRETEVLSLLAKGMKNKRIAEELDLSYRTVVTHVYNIYRKLKISSRTEAIHYAISNGLVTIEKQ